MLSTDGVAGAGYDPTTGYADPAAVVNGYARKARELGADIRQGTKVIDVLMEGDSVTGVVTNQGTISAPKIVNAAGVWASGISSMARITLPVVPVRVQVASFKVPANFTQPRLIIGDNINRCYIRPEGKDLLLVGTRSQPGAHPPVDPDWNVERIDPEHVVKAGSMLCNRIPAMENGEATGGYASMYDMSPDGHFILEAVPERPGFYTAAGFSGHGFKHSPVVGKIMSDLVCDGATDEIVIEPFSSRRFTDERPPLRGIYKGFAF
jgi:sarcosine oxidase subunit beta